MLKNNQLGITRLVILTKIRKKITAVIIFNLTDTYKDYFLLKYSAVKNAA